MLAFIALVVAVTNFLSGALLQQAMDVQTQDRVTNRTMKMDITAQIPDGWTGAIDDTKPGNISFQHNFLSTMQQWYRKEPITATKLDEAYLCPGVCTGDVFGAGIIWNFSTTTDSLVLDDPERNGSLAFATNFDRFDSEWGYPTLRVISKYVTAVNDSCGATITIDTYNISMSTIRYPVTIINQTITLNMSQLHQVSINQTYNPLKSTGDSNSTKPDWGAGPLAALDGFANAYFLSNATVNYNGTTRIYDVDMNGMLARLYYDTNDTHYNAITTCAHQFSSPTDDILNALHEITFRTALQSNNGTTMNFTAKETDKMPFYVVRSRFWIPALTIMSFALVILLFPILGQPHSQRDDVKETEDTSRRAQGEEQLESSRSSDQENSNDQRLQLGVSDLDYEFSLDPIEVARAFHFQSEKMDVFLQEAVQYQRKSGGEGEETTESQWHMAMKRPRPVDIVKEVPLNTDLVISPQAQRLKLRISS
jgi:hypothetical protein